MSDHTPEFTQPQLPFDEIPYGYCHCGCGQKTNVAAQNRAAKGLVKNQPRLYLRGHYRKGQTGGTQKRLKSSTDRFWEKVDVRGSDDCWEWQGAILAKGYGHFTVGVHRIMAHRFSWMINKGEIPVDDSYHGVCVLHKCDNPKCVNPDHLFLGTQADNMKDKSKKGRARGTKQKLTPEQVNEIKVTLSSRQRPSLRYIASKYGVSHNAIWFIDKGLSYHG